jgi:hypothetical protein
MIGVSPALGGIQIISLLAQRFSEKLYTVLGYFFSEKRTESIEEAKIFQRKAGETYAIGHSVLDETSRIILTFTIKADFKLHR